MDNHPQLPRTLVVTSDSVHPGDDALGRQVVELVRRSAIPGLAAVDLGERPDLLLDLLEDVEVLIVVDAIRVPFTPAGKIVQLNWPMIRTLPDIAGGTDGISLIEQLLFAHRLGILPPVVRLVGLTIGRIEDEMPPEAMAERAAEVIECIARFLGLTVTKARHT